MRIVQVVESLEMGGLERLAIQLATAEQIRGHRCGIYCVFRAGGLAPLAREHGIGVRCFDKVPGPSLKSLAQLVRAFRVDRPDVVHTHNSGIHHYAVVAARLAGVPVVVNTRHSPFTSEHTKRERHYAWALRYTDRVVFVSETTRDQVTQSLGNRRFSRSVILNGIPTQDFRGHDTRAGVRTGNITFGTVGRLVPIKAHDVLIEAFAEIVEEFPLARLRIAGGGPLMVNLQQQISQKGLSGAISLEGPTLAPQRFYRDIDVFVLPSRSEGMPLVLLEAMASGLPIVATRVGGIPEIVQNDIGWLCQPDDPYALVAAMRDAARSPDLARRGAAAAKLALDRFDIDTMCDQYLDLFRQLLGRRASVQVGSQEVGATR
jgi:glycosyltransferase involved in cell wall biosynthesis